MPKIQMYVEASIVADYDFGPDEQRIREKLEGLELRMQMPQPTESHAQFDNAKFLTNFGYQVGLKDELSYSPFQIAYGRWTGVEGEMYLEDALSLLSDDTQVYQQFVVGYGSPDLYKNTCHILGPNKAYLGNVPPHVAPAESRMTIDEGDVTGRKIRKYLQEHLGKRMESIGEHPAYEGINGYRFDANFADVAEMMIDSLADNIQLTIEEHRKRQAAKEERIEKEDQEFRPGQELF